MIGDLLGDGHLRFTHKDINGKVKGNAHYAMTLKHYDYACYLCPAQAEPGATLPGYARPCSAPSRHRTGGAAGKNIYSSICTITPLVLGLILG